MKKLFVLVLGLVAVCPAFGATCKNNNVTVTYEGNQKPKDDEFLYMSKHEYDMSVSGYETSGHNSGNGHGFECDYVNSANCQRGAVIEMPAGHVFEGNVINVKRSYRCSTTLGTNNYWDVVEDEKCHTKFGDIPVGEHAMQNEVMRVLSKVDCSGYTLTSDLGTEFEGVCRDGAKFVCKAMKCIEGYEPDSGGACVLSTNVVSGAECTATGGMWTTSTKECNCADNNKNLRQKADKLSCECASGFDWVDINDKTRGCHKKSNPGKKESAKEKCVNSWGEYKNNKCVCDAARNLVESNGECICKDSNYERDDASHTCKKKAGVITQEECAQISGAQWVANKCVCTEVGKLLDMTYMKCLYPDGYEACHNQSAVADWIDGRCVCKQAGYNWNGSSCVETSDHVIGGIFDKISAIEAKFDTSKWKNAEGKFNTARLASDSIAGVVLGTVGGVVTSTVMKKSQVKNGFEDIKCVIGGQTVASYDDQFSVGLK